MPYGYSSYLKEQGYKDTTIDEHVRQLEYFFIFLDGLHKREKELYEIVPADIKQYIKYKKSRDLKISTINKIIAIIRRFFDYAWMIDKVAVDPAQKIRYEPITKDDNEPVDYRTLLELKEAVNQDIETPMKRKIIFILAMAGLRPDEFNITWNEVIIDKQLIRLFINKKGHERVINISGADAEVFKQFSENQQSLYVLNSKSRDGVEKPLERMTISLNLRKISDKSNLNTLTTNNIRRAYGEYLLESETYDSAAEMLGIDKLSLMKLLSSS
ncbi:MAG: hypothetical protein EA344_07235 [Alkalicoccus sp.]|nr:MAG: hypothetical protein EA344_07235 [Alkalicoccus sp.]